jgi:cyclophilin family peptidyl-prolyl cis-trans isomerase
MARVSISAGVSQNQDGANSWKQSAMYAFLHQPFEEAIQPAVPLGARRPPDVTITGKSVGKLFEEVKRRWSAVTFATETGTLRRPIATVETELGEMDIALWPEVAPNHVRAFVALAECGYYDGLFFEIRLGDRKDSSLPRAIGGGSPEANAQESASIGFWLKPEILRPEQAKARGIRHQAGTVFCHWLGCFFYISLTEAPMWDGEFVIFGEVVRNINVAEQIFDRLAEESNPPQIRQVRIQWHDTGKALNDLR